MLQGLSGLLLFGFSASRTVWSGRALSRPSRMGRTSCPTSMSWSGFAAGCLCFWEWTWWYFVWIFWETKETNQTQLSLYERDHPAKTNRLGWIWDTDIPIHRQIGRSWAWTTMGNEIDGTGFSLTTTSRSSRTSGDWPFKQAFLVKFPSIRSLQDFDTR